MSNSIGTVFRVTSVGESHGKCVGAVVDGCPAGLKLDMDALAKEMARRRPGASSVTTSRGEDDAVEVLSGVHEGHATGAPILMLTWNRDADSSKYDAIRDRPRPGHADYTTRARYRGFNDHRGGGRASGRITAGFVMAGAVAKQVLATIGVEVHAYTRAIGGVEAPEPSGDWVKAAEASMVRCPDPVASEAMIRAVEEAKKQGDSVGGEVACVATRLPAGVGQPVFDTIEGDVAKALFAVPAVKAVEFGAGRRLAAMRGSEANDPYEMRDGRVQVSSNNAGGVLGGLTTGAPMTLRATFKPTPSIAKSQRTVDLAAGTDSEISVEGRHDPCIVPRAVPVVEAMVAIVLADHALRRGTIPQVLGEKK
ncbi:TPA: chorismate synthase [Candidatus Bathyarchaeota archaeon]|nr:chorismate synthase [Candidatus Bathyarchaeota archaeon]